MRGLRERWERARTEEDFAWACLITNVVGIPGLGTLMARRWEGLPQLALSLVSGVLITYWLGAFVMAELREPGLPPPGAPDLRFVLWGTALFAAGWLWGLASGLGALRQARRHPSRSAPPPP